MPNSVAFLVLGLWPLVMLGLFRALPPGRALIWSVLASYLILPPYPTAFDFPLLPALDKTTIPNIMAIILAVTYSKQKIIWLPRSVLGKLLVLVFVFSPTATVLSNPEPIVFSMDVIRGLYTQDIFAMVIMQMILLANFILARHFLHTEKDLRDLLLALMIAAAAYAFPMLVEIRLSPQLNIWIYGFFQHMFEQMMRGDGFRPIVFLSHGIWAAMLVMTGLSAAVVLIKNTEGPMRQRLIGVAIFLAVVLVLCKTLSALIYGGIFAALVLGCSWRLQIKVALVLGLLALAYPVAKGANWVPEERLLAMAENVSAERAHSLGFRFEHEGDLLERAQRKPLFGWGIWGRNQIHDPITGRITSVSDGRWVLVLGILGWTGFIAEFGLLFLPILLIFRASTQTMSPWDWRRHQKTMMQFPVRASLEERLHVPEISPLAAGLALMLAINMVDLLPNATLTNLTWLIAGALLGYAEMALSLRRARHGVLPQAGPQGPPTRPRTIL